MSSALLDDFTDYVEEWISIRSCPHCMRFIGEVIGSEKDCPHCTPRCECGNRLDKDETECDQCIDARPVPRNSWNAARWNC